MSIYNNGTISTVYLYYGGFVTNGISGLIQGYNGVELGGAGAVINDGRIAGIARYSFTVGEYIGVGIQLRGSGGGSVTNDASGVIFGSRIGVDVQTTGGSTVTNSGTITGGAGRAGDSNYNGYRGGGGVYFENGGSIFNPSMNVYGPGSVINSGAITGGVGGAGGPIFSSKGGRGGAGVYLENGGGVTNFGTITGGAGGVGTFYGPGLHYSLDGDQGGSGVYLANSGSVSNSGTIVGGVGGAGSAGVYVRGYENGIGGHGGLGGGGVRILGEGSVTNSGTIAGGAGGAGGYGEIGNFNPYQHGGNGSAGVFLQHGGVTNSGMIVGGAGGAGGDAGFLPGNGGNGAAGVYIVDEGSVTNSGTIIGGAGGRGGHETATSQGFHGFYQGSPGHGGGGVLIGGGGSVSNGSTGLIEGRGNYGVAIGGATATLENAGTISGGGGFSVFLSGNQSNLLIVDGGATFNGYAYALRNSANTLELTNKYGAGTISRFGNQYVHFGTIAIDSGATWTVGGIEAGFSGVTIGRFNTHDTLDLTNLSFAAGLSVNLNRTTDLLSIYGSGATLLDTIQLAGSFTGQYFHLTSDGASGTSITEDGIACYLRGTRIMTYRGPVAVEELKIGDHLVTADGIMPLKWIGRRAYAGWLAVGNPDVQPILFKAGSIADHVPTRDLMVSPEHAMFLDGVLIPARHLVNGVSILQMQGLDEIHYFHLELDRHSVIFAEDAASESFVDDDSRGMFHNVYEFHALYPDARRSRYAEYCAPRVEDGYELEAVRRVLMARAVRLLPDGTAAAVALQGYLDCVTPTTVEGWAYNPDAPDQPVTLAILANGAVIGRVVADLHRRDLAQAGIGKHAYRFTLPRGFGPDIRHAIEVRRESDWSPLIGSPSILETICQINHSVPYDTGVVPGVSALL